MMMMMMMGRSKGKALAFGPGPFKKRRPWLLAPVSHWSIFLAMRQASALAQQVATHGHTQLLPLCLLAFAGRVGIVTIGAVLVQQPGLDLYLPLSCIVVYYSSLSRGGTLDHGATRSNSPSPIPPRQVTEPGDEVVHQRLGAPIGKIPQGVEKVQQFTVAVHFRLITAT